MLHFAKTVPSEIVTCNPVADQLAGHASNISTRRVDTICAFKTLSVACYAQPGLIDHTSRVASPNVGNSHLPINKTTEEISCPHPADHITHRGWTQVPSSAVAPVDMAALQAWTGTVHKVAEANGRQVHSHKKHNRWCGFIVKFAEESTERGI